MKKILVFFLTLVLMFSFAPSTSAANSITSRLKGRLLLQVQDKGRVWYVDPVGLQKHEVTFANALNLFQKLALGITNADLNHIPIDADAVSDTADSDNDGYSDRQEVLNGYNPEIASNSQNRGNDKMNFNQALRNRLKGRLLLQVQDRGRIWYIDQNGKRWEVTWGNLMSLFRKLALGITDKDLGEVGNVETLNWKTYTNSEYGFKFELPESWNKYSIVVDEWDGYTPGAQGDEIVEQGPEISIRHPGWTIQNPRQDIPIMVFTLSQWNSLQEDNFHIGAAPVGPKELGRNSKYVFALPARYNYAFLTGYEEVIRILENNPLRAF